MNNKVSIAGIARIALPTLGVLLAVPVFLLLDTAVVGRLGTESLAALGAAGTVFAMVTTHLTFLSYGTTSRAAHRFGAGDLPAAITEGVQATWVALGVGLVLAVIVGAGAPVIMGTLVVEPVVAEQGARWLRITGCAIPLVLLEMAGNGWMRGVQRSTAPLVFTFCGVVPAACLLPLLVDHLGLVGSAWATLLCFAIIAALFVAALAGEFRRHCRPQGGSLRPQGTIIRAQLVLGRDLILRSLSFQVAFLSAVAVVGRIAGSPGLAAHQILIQLWSFVVLALDSLAIAAQTLVGAALGAGSSARARSVGVRVTCLTGVGGAFLAGVLVLLGGHIHRLFTQDPAVLSQLGSTWPVVGLMVVLGGVLFALDGVLLGAGDARFLRTITIAAVLGGFLPGLWLAAVLGTGLVGVWAGIAVFILIRLVAVLWRFTSMRWAGAV